MATTQQQITIDAPLETVWPILTDFGNTYRWNPEVPVSHSLGELETGLGARRKCELNASGSKWIEEEIVAFDDADHHYTVRLVGGPAKPPIDDVQVKISATPQDANRTVVTMAAELTGDGLLQRAMAGAGSVAMGRVFRKVLAGLDAYAVNQTV